MSLRKVASFGIPVTSIEAEQGPDFIGTAFGLPGKSASAISWTVSYDATPSAHNVILQASLDGIVYWTLDTNDSVDGGLRLINTSAKFVRAYIVEADEDCTVIFNCQTYNETFEQSIFNFNLAAPIDDGTNGQVLTTDGSGGLSFEDAGGGNPFDQDLNTDDTPEFYGLYVLGGSGDPDLSFFWATPTVTYPSPTVGYPNPIRFGPIVTTPSTGRSAGLALFELNADVALGDDLDELYDLNFGSVINLAAGKEIAYWNQVLLNTSINGGAGSSIGDFDMFWLVLNNSNSTPITGDFNYIFAQSLAGAGVLGMARFLNYDGMFAVEMNGEVLAPIIRPSNVGAETLKFQVYDVNGMAYRDWMTATNGDAPDVTFIPPTTGTLVMQATTYKSSDGSSGVTAGPFTVISSIEIKNGLVVGLTGS